MNDPYRQTGRTTRMLLQAILAVRMGNTVYVAMATYAQIEYAKRLVQELEGAQGIKWLAISSGDTAWLPSEPRAVAFIDHHADQIDYAPASRESQFRRRLRAAVLASADLRQAAVRQARGCLGREPSHPWPTEDPEEPPGVPESV